MTKPRRASIGVALIARDAESTIGQCLDSFRKHVSQVVVCVDELSRDKTAALAKKHGAEVYPVKVSDWHECDGHGKILVQHFADARNKSFEHLDPSLDFWLWIDSDDVLEGAEHLPRICEELKEANALGAWFPYVYGNVEGRPSTIFHRERLLRASAGWKWRYRVHEVVEAQSQTDRGWQIREDVRLIHQDHERSEPAPVRNLRCQEVDLEDHPDDERLLFYMGNQYFAIQDNEAAIYWYERLLEKSTNPYQSWQGAVYLSHSFQRLGDVDSSERAALKALAIMPQHPEPYYQLAVCARMRGDHERCVYWTREARTNKVAPPFFVFKNPLDYTFNSRMVLSDSLASLGHIPEARHELEQAVAVLPVESVQQDIQRYQKLENASHLAQAYVTLAASMPDDAKIGLWEALEFPPDIKQFGRARDIVMPAYLRQRPNTQPRMVFWCGRSLEEWSPESLNSTGIGGSETAVVEIARRFGAAGWRVDVYNGAGRFEGVYDGVGYWEPERFGSGEQASVLVSWRQPQFHSDAYALRYVLWCHDLNYGPLPDNMQRFDQVLGVSQWHADYLSRMYGVVTDFVPNGINLDRFKLGQRRAPMQVVYASSPDRGLSRLLRLWPEVLKAEPGAQLKVAYGWENFDKMLESRPDMRPWKQAIVDQLERTPNVEWLGRLPQDKLADLWGTSYAWAYPSEFLEVSCITAMEAMAGGAVPVTSAAGALMETVSGAGVVVTGSPYSRSWETFYVHCLIAVLREANLRQPLIHAGHARARELTWDKSFERWTMIVDDLLKENSAGLSKRNGVAHADEKVLVPA